MILFIVIAIGILIYTIFAKDFLIDSIKNFNNQKKTDYKSILEIVLWWFLSNFILNCANAIIVFIISAIVVFAYPRTETQYSFNINSLKDNLVTSGEIHGSAFCIRGSIDGEISYFFSRTTDK